MAVNVKMLLRMAGLVGTALAPVISYLHDHPETWEKVKAEITKLIRNKGNLSATIAILQDEVTYLAGSADDEDEVRRAQAWAKQLEKYEHAAQLLKAPGAPKSEKAKLKSDVKALHKEIFGAFVEEQVEDAQAAEGARSES